MCAYRLFGDVFGFSTLTEYLSKFIFQCEPIHGWGFRRGGYQCRCRPGFRLPTVTRRPFLGEILERATSEQFADGFDCLKIGCTCLDNSYRSSNVIIFGCHDPISRNILYNFRSPLYSSGFEFRET